MLPRRALVGSLACLLPSALLGQKPDRGIALQMAALEPATITFSGNITSAFDNAWGFNILEAYWPPPPFKDRLLIGTTIMVSQHRFKTTAAETSALMSAYAFCTVDGDTTSCDPFDGEISATFGYMALGAKLYPLGTAQHVAPFAGVMGTLVGVSEPITQSWSRSAEFGHATAFGWAYFGGVDLSLAPAETGGLFVRLMVTRGNVPNLNVQFLPELRMVTETGTYQVLSIGVGIWS